MGKKGKYEGGSVPVTFRLPAKDLEKAKAGVENYLRRFEAGYDETFGSFIDGILSVYEEKTDSVLENSDPEEGLLVFKTDGQDRTPRLNIDFDGSFGKPLQNPKERLEIDPLAFETLSLDPEMIGAKPEERIPGTLKKKGLGKGQQMRSEKKIDAPRLITYDCGCVDDGIFYRRDPSCRLDRDQHKRVVIKNQ